MMKNVVGCSPRKNYRNPSELIPFTRLLVIAAMHDLLHFLRFPQSVVQVEETPCLSHLQRSR